MGVRVGVRRCALRSSRRYSASSAACCCGRHRRRLRPVESCARTSSTSPSRRRTSPAYREWAPRRGGDEPPNYDYENPGENVRDEPDLTANWKTDLQKLIQKYGTDTSRLASGTPEHLYASRLRHITDQLKKGKEPLPWEKWLNKTYIPNQGNPRRGTRYEKLITEEFGLGGDDWLCQESMHEVDGKRKYDAVNRKLRIIYEFKAGDKEVASQLTEDRETLAKLNARGEGEWQIRYILGGDDVKDSTITRIERGSNGGITARRLQAFPNVTNAKVTAPGPASDVANPDPKAPATGAATEFVENTADDPAQAAALDEAFEEEAQAVARDAAVVEGLSEEEALVAAMENAGLRPGGIDFTTLELRYMAEDGSGVKYAFNAQNAPDGVHSFGGLAAAHLSSDALFAWLELPASSFWVNLNPDQPDKIIDPQLGRTDAGRVLLQSDLQMKKTVAKLLDPATPLGTQFWNQLQSKDENLPCMQWRNWIVPAPASVRENGGELFILDAPLQVKSAPASFSTPVGGLPCPSQPEAITKHNQQVIEQLILPEVEKAVNTAPEYEDLRRVYLARVTAEWLKQFSAVKPNAYTPLIGKGDISRWPARTPWNPRDVFDKMLKSLRDGEFTYTVTRTVGGRQVTQTAIVGGVDFSSSPRESLPAQTFAQKFPALPRTVQHARSQPVALADPKGDRTWLGAGTRPGSHAGRARRWPAGDRHPDHRCRPDRPDPADRRRAARIPVPTGQAAGVPGLIRLAGAGRGFPAGTDQKVRAAHRPVHGSGPRRRSAAPLWVPGAEPCRRGGDGVGQAAWTVATACR